MVIELSNPAFREKLKSRNLWQRIIDSIANLFGFRKDSSNYAKISKNLSDIIDNYDTNFTKSYENLESNFTDFAKKNTIESKDSNQGKSVEKEILNELKTYKTLKQKDINDLKEASDSELSEFIDNLFSDDLERIKWTKNVLFLGNINENLAKNLKLENTKIYIHKNEAHHAQISRKEKYQQNIPIYEYKNIHNTIKHAKEAYIDTIHNNFFITKPLSDNQIAVFTFNKDKLGNYFVTAKRANKNELNKKEYILIKS